MSKKINLIGQRFGRLQVIDAAESQNGRAAWVCQCDCGKVIITIGKRLRNGDTKSCGCLQREKTSLLKSKDLTDKKFGKLKVLEYDLSYKGKKEKHWLCRCDCGSIVSISTYNLTSGRTYSCGCVKSKGEEKVAFLLSQNNLSFIREKTFESCLFQDTKRKAKFDFYVNNEYIIEYDGIQHFIQNGWSTKERLFYTKQHDKIKNEWCFKNNIPIIRIPYYDLEKITIEDLRLKTSKYLLKEENI